MKNKILNLAIFVLIFLIVITSLMFFIDDNNKKVEEKINSVLLEKIKTPNVDLSSKEKIIVQLKNDKDLEKVEEYIYKEDIKGKFKIGNSIVVEVPLNEIKNIAKEDRVDSIWPDTVYYALLDNSVNQINAPRMWDFGYTGENIRIAILDTGINETHPMLNGKVVLSKDFTDSNFDVQDRQGHGTHVAGIAAGKKIDEETLNGVAPNALLINAKVLGDEGQGSTITVIEGINWALDPDNNPETNDGADVLSLSLGANVNEDGPLNNALREAAKEAVIVVASGNCGSLGIPSCNGYLGVSSPGNTKEVITVGAVDDFNQWAYFSSGQDFGNYIKPDVVAPGIDILSSDKSGYGIKSGTSMATPHVSGIAALLLDWNENLTHDDVKYLLESTAIRLGPPGKDIKFGSGLVDVSRLLPIDLNQILRHRLFFDEVVEINKEIKIAVNTTVGILNINAEITDPFSQIHKVEFEKIDNITYNARFNDTGAIGTYKLDIFIEDIFYDKIEFNKFFDVIESSEINWNIESVLFNNEIELDKDFNVEVYIRNNNSNQIPLNVDMQIWDNNTLLFSEDKLKTVNDNSNEIFNFTWKANKLGNKLLRIIAVDEFNNNIINDFNFTVVNKNSPNILNFNTSYYGKHDLYVIDFIVKDYEDFNVSLEITSPSNVNYIMNKFNKIKLNDNLYNVFIIFTDVEEFGGYTADLQICNSNGCSNKEDDFSILNYCSVGRILFIEQEGSISLDNQCTVNWNIKKYGYPNQDYLNSFSYLYYRENKYVSDKEINSLLLNYSGNLILEGEDIGLVHGNDDFMIDVAHSRFLRDIVLNQSLVIEFEKHPIFNDFENLTLEYGRFIYPDLIEPVNSYSLADYENGSLVIVYNDAHKVLYLPFNIESVSNYELFLGNILEWFFDESEDLIINNITYDYLIEGVNEFIVNTNYKGNPDVYIDGVKQDVYTNSIFLGYGDHEITFVINPEFKLKERNYINNKKTINVNVASSKADVLIKNLKYNYGKNKIFIDVNLSNVGGENAKGILQYYFDDNLTDSINFSLDFNSDIKFKKEFGITNGNHVLKIIAELDNRENDFNFSNNILSEELYVCYKENILVIVDDDSGEFVGNISEKNEFTSMLEKNGYCIEEWKESEKSVPDTGYLNKFDLLIWSTGNYWGGVMNQTDLDLLKGYTGNILFEGSDILFDNRENEDLKRMLHAQFRNDLKLNNNALLILKEHKILDNITKIEIDYTMSPYPDALTVLDGYGIADWEDNGTAIIAYNDSKKKMLYFAFGINSVNDNAREKLILNSVGWLLEDELEVNYGDVNFDNKVNILDIVKIVNHIIGISNFTDPRQLKAADVDFKEGITSNDVVIIVDYILGKIKVLPYKPQSSVINNQYSPNLVANDVNVKYSDNNLVADISVKNIGNGIFYEEINNTITLTKNNNENITISRKEKLKLNPRESKVLSFTYNNISNESYKISAEIDSKSEAIESNKDDNSKEIVFKI